MIATEGVSTITRNARYVAALGLAMASTVDLAVTPAGSAAEPLYRIAAQWPVGGTTGWDCLTFDAVRSRLFVTRADHIDVVDTRSGQISATIAGTAGVHAVALAPELHRGYASNGKANSVTVFDLDTLQVLREVPVSGVNPDEIVYVPGTQQILTMNGRSNNATVLDANTLASVATIALPGKPEFAVEDRHGNLFVNIETEPGELIRIDSKTLKITATWMLTGCNSPSGIALDARHSRLFSSCDDKVLAVTDATNGRAVARISIGDHPDGAAFDSTRQLIFSSNGDGSLSIVHEDGPNHYSALAPLLTQRGARTLAFDAATRRIYSITADFGPTSAPTAAQPRPRPAILPGTARVLVMEAVR